ncbi:MAG: neprosin family prolyl endopeptidase [Byssovorax sp.]
MPLLGGCIIEIGAGNDQGAAGGATTNPPPGGSGGEGALTDAQQARKDEADRYVAQVIYKGATVTQSLQLASGDVVDGLDRSTFPDLPYALPPLPWSPADVTLPPDVTLALTDVAQIPELADLVSKAAVFHRPTFWPYILGETDATSLEDYLDRYEVGGAPAPKGNRLYAGLGSTQANRGVSGYMNQFQPGVAASSFSLVEFTVGCPAGNPTEMVGVVISVDNYNVGGRNEKGVHDGLPRLHVEYANSKSGKMKYIWDELDGTFVANPLRRVHPGQVVPVSVLGGAQVEHLLTIFQSPIGDWWVAYDQELVGYYPASAFTMLNGGACESRWYGEVYNPDPKNGAVKTGMGSGKFAEAGRPNVAYVRKPHFYDTSWFSVEPAGLKVTSPTELSCYTRSELDPDLVSGGQIFTLGGPGGKDPGCKWPFP